MTTASEADTTGATLGGRSAVCVDRPESLDALCQVVATRVAEGLAIYPQGGRTALDYGGDPTRDGVALDLTGLDRIVDYPWADMTITVEVGITLARLQAVLAERGQRLALDPPQAERATVGGILATNAAGPRRFGLGRPRDQIIGVQFVSAEGQAIHGGGRVVKNVAGYDLPKLMIGALGTLGVITQATFKVRPLPEASAVVWAAIDDRATALAALERSNLSGTRPVAVELLNQAALRFASLHGAPAPETPWALVFGFEDNRPSVDWQLGAIARELPEAALTVVRDAEAASSWSALIEHAADPAASFALRTSVRPSDLGMVLDVFEGAAWSVQAHAGSGVMHVLWFDPRQPLTESDAAAALHAAREAAARGFGHVVVVRCSSAWKGRLSLWGAPRPDWPSMARLKQALDPTHALNPGRLDAIIGSGPPRA